MPLAPSSAACAQESAKPVPEGQHAPCSVTHKGQLCSRGDGGRKPTSPLAPVPVIVANERRLGSAVCRLVSRGASTVAARAAASFCPTEL